MVPIFVEHWGGLICNFTPILPDFQHWGDEPQPRSFSDKQIKWRPKKKVFTKNWRVFSPKSREDHKKGPNIIQRSDADPRKTRAGHLRRNYFTCDSACASTIFKRLRWRLCRKYFSNFERNRASAIQISLRLKIIVFQQLWLKFRKKLTRKVYKSLVIGNCIRLLLAKLRYTARFTAGVFHWNFFHEMFCRFFKNSKFFNCVFQKTVAESDFKEKNYFYNCLSRNTLLVPKKS